MTLPPANATVSALARPPVRAASVVRTLARVAACIPRNPAAIELRPPNTKEAPIRQPTVAEEQDGHQAHHRQDDQVLPAQECHGAGLDETGDELRPFPARGLAVQVRIDQDGRDQACGPNPGGIPTNSARTIPVDFWRAKIAKVATFRGL